MERDPRGYLYDIFVLMLTVQDEREGVSIKGLIFAKISVIF